MKKEKIIIIDGLKGDEEMKKRIRGRVYVTGDDIDTDQIIPANYLVYRVDDPEESKLYGKYAFAGLPNEVKESNPFKEEDSFTSEYTIVIAGKNFGCGSSREHAPLALERAGIDAVVAESYARIFYRNSVDGGFIVPYECAGRLSEKFSSGDEGEICRESNTIKNITRGTEYSLKPLGDVEDIIEAGGIFQ